MCRGRANAFLVISWQARLKQLDQQEYIFKCHTWVFRGCDKSFNHICTCIHYEHRAGSHHSVLYLEHGCRKRTGGGAYKSCSVEKDHSSVRADNFINVKKEYTDVSFPMQYFKSLIWPNDITY